MGQISEAEISMVLDTYMYLNYQQAAEGDHISHILTELEKLPDYQPGGRYYGEYTIIKQAAENEQIGNLTISCQSAAMGYDPGTAACTFSAPDQSTVYVVYRGTGDGEWPDNGIGMSSTATIQQNRALAYFEEVVERMGLTGNQHLVITGHSKGGNKAQFVTMESRYQDLVDACYSVDGQGFSPEAVKKKKEKYGEEGYEEKTRKIKGIYGENDYVSALGLSIIPKGSIRYIRTPVEKSNFAGYHDIKYLFADWEKTSGKEIVYTGRKNQDAPGRGILGNYAAALSAWVMSLPVQKRDGCAAVVMQAMESMQGRKDGINGEKLTMSDVSDFAFLGIPLIAGNLILGQEGKELIEAVVGKESFVCQVPGNLYLCVDIPALSNCAFKLEQEMGRIAEMKEQILKAAQAVPVYMKGWIGLHRKINLAAGVLGRLEKQLGQLLEIQRQISHSYKKWEEDAMEIAALSIDFCEKIQ